MTPRQLERHLKIAAQKTARARKKLEALAWKHTHRDFKGVTDGVKMRLHLNPKTGGTESWPLSSFTDAELIEKLPSAIRATLENK